MAEQEKSIESIYPLSPMQQGMLFHTLLSPKSGVYFNQILYTLTGELQKTAMLRAWQQVVDRHEPLRTLFVWEGREKSLQVVRRRVMLPWEEHDWRGFSADEQSAKLAAFLQADRQRGFDLAQAPLMRLALIRLEESHYELIWSHHHLLMDGWSSFLILKDVRAIYQALSEGRDYRLERLRPYRDYINWLQGQDLSKAEGFWRAALKGFAVPTPLLGSPVNVRHEDQVSEVAEQLDKLSWSLMAALRSFARRHDLTLSTIIHGAWAMLLSRYSGEGDVVFGSTVSGRPAELAGVESMVGLFINTLPVRAQFSLDDTVVSWLKEFQSKLVELRQYEHSPLVDVQGWSEVHRDQPLFQSLFLFENYPVDAWEQPGALKISNIRGFERTNYPLTVVVVPRKELAIRVRYDPRRFDAAVITRMLGHFNTLLAGIVTNPDQRLSDLPLLTSAERQQIVVEWNRTEVSYPQDRCLDEFIEEQAERTPAAVAVVFEGKHLTYRQLNERANQLAHNLQKLGVGPDTLVGICVERSLEMVVGLLGILKAGGAYVPLDPNYPQDRLAFILDDARPRVLLTQQSLRDRLRAQDATVLCVDALAMPPAGGEHVPSASERQASDPAYVIYTSGSTGQPKGVQITHGALVNFLKAMEHDPGITEEDKLLSVTSLSFDIAGLELYLPLMVGAQVTIAPSEVAADGSRLASLISECGATIMQATPATWRLLLEAGWEGSQHLKILCGGEAWSAELARALLPRCGSLWNMYGPTETTVWSAVAKVESGGPIVIGTSIANTQFYILDQHLQPMPIGLPGELHIGGAGLARGYHHRPELTAEKFIADPFRTEPGARLYKTGDLARYLPDGAIEYLGRLDHQVKIRGFRIELGEIESTLAGLPGIRDAVVVAREDVAGDKRLVAYLTRGQEPPEDSELRRQLQEKLPDYMVPSAFVTLDQLPLTPNGKVDRKALPAPDLTPRVVRAAPSTPQEEILCSLFAKTLGLERVGIDDNFFDLGGHSLLAIRLISRIRTALGVEVAIGTLFEAPTVEALAKRLHEGQVARPALKALPRPSELPLSFAQSRLWFLDRFEGRSATYTIPIAVRLEGELNRAALEAALGDLVARHETLRTIFPDADGVPHQVILEADAARPRLAVEAVASATLPDALTKAAQRGFDLATEGPLRAHLFTLGAREHVLLLLLHHIAGDGWSVTPLWRDLACAYAARLEGGAPALSAMPVQYADYTLWQHRLLGREDDPQSAIARQLAFWTDNLKNLPAEIELPSDRLRPLVASYRGDRVPLHISAELHRGLVALARKAEASLFMVLQAALSALFTRLGAGTDIPIGSPIAGRTDSGLDDLVGLFVNTLVLRTDTSGDPSFRELIARVRATNLAAYDHQELPFERLVEVLNPERSMSRHPLFQVMLVLQNNAPVKFELAGLTTSPELIITGSAKFDLSLSLTEQRAADGSPAGINGAIEYATDLHDASRIERLVGHFRALLEGAVTNPEQRLADLPLLTSAERQQLLVDWNRTDVAYAKDQCLHEAFEEQAERTPEAVAVVFEESKLTYRELNRRADEIAQQLRVLGVGPNVLVGLFVERSLDIVVGMLGVLKAGGAYIPLDPTHPRKRLAYVLADARPLVLLTQGRLQSELPPHRSHVVAMDAGARLDHAPAPARPCSPRDLAYVIYTSGSTGEPKGVAVEHRSVVNMLASMRRQLGVGAEDTMLAITTLTFDIAALEIFLPLVCGASVVIAASRTVGDGSALADLIERNAVSVMQATPATLRMLIDAGWEGTPRLKILCGGEAWTAALAKQLLPRCGSLWNMYGPTETTVWSAVAKVESGAPIVIGAPIANTQFYILDQHLQPMPIGLPGELHIGGAGLARGYHHRPELTAEKFIADPFRTEPGARLYKTGDLARYLPDGAIEYLGRLDHQVKIRGFRIELGEIESTLAGLPGIRDAVVVAREDVAGDKRLVAYLTRGQEPPEDSELRRQLQEKLPDYMVPSAFVTLDQLPLTPNGKVDRKALPAPDLTPRVVRAAPSTPQEEILCSLFAKTLGLERVGVDDNFFDLGGHSLLAIRLISRIRTALGVEVAIGTLFEAPTVEALAKRLHEGQVARPALKALPRPSELPLSFAQSRLWFLDRFEGRSATYTIPIAVRLEGELNRAALEAALGDLVARHETLRTIFPDADGVPHQVILEADAARPRLAVEAVASATLPDALTKAAQRGFDLATEGPLRAHLFTLGAREHVLLLLLHHIAGDGWSVTPLWRDLACAYAARLEGGAPALSAMPVQYADYTLWQHRLLGREDDPQSAIARQLAFWTDNLKNLPAEIELPSDRLRPLVASYRGDRVPLHISAELHRGLVALARKAEASLFMVLQAALSALFTRLGAGTDIPIGSPIAGRTDSGLDDLVGLFVNTLVLRTDTSGDPSFRELIARVRATNLAAYDHQELPFERLVEVLNPERSMSRHPLFQVMLVLQNNAPVKFELAGLTTSPELIITGSAKFDLSLSLTEQRAADGSPAGINGAIEYATDLHDASRIERLVGHFRALLEGAVTNPEQRLADLPLLTSAERQQLLVDWNRTDVAYAKDQCLHEAFEEQAERTPEAVAVVFEESKLTYRELNRRADEIAQQLRVLGVGPNVLVGLFVERSLDIVVGMLGVLKAGGAYVPLDPNHPSKRLASILADADPLILLTQERLKSKLPTHRAHVVVVDADEIPTAPLNHVRPSLATDGLGDLAYVIYTSGSTGEPKGVAVEHRSVVNMLASMRRRPGLGAEDAMLAVTTLTFDIAALEIFLPLVCGARVVIAGSRTVGDGSALADLIERNAVSVMQATPATLRMLVDAGWHGASRLKILCGGEAWSSELANELLPRCGSLWNMYGPTETTVWSAVARVESGAPIVIGAPIANTQFYILDQHLQPMPIGLPGELHIGGAGLARGYHNRPELTAEKFIPDPFRSEPEARLYKTGDLARYLPDGAIEYLGRMDQQVKIRGFRIELGEIESALAGLPGIRDAVVVAREDVAGDKRLVAYLTRGEEPPEDSELRRQLQEKLPDYMVPSAFVTLDQLPLTPNGKVDRKALPAPDLTPRVVRAAPSTPQEEILCSLFAKTLGLERVGVDDNFFDLGGHSLLAIRVISDINKTLKADLRVATFFQNPTVEQLARVLEQKFLDRPRQPRLLQLSPGRIGPTLYFIGGGPPEVGIAKSIGEDRDVFAIDLPIPAEWVHGLAAADPAKLPTAAKMVALFTDLMRTHARSSPCVIVGYCFFGMIAFEAARALQRAGGNVASVVLVDAFRRSPRRWWQTLRWIWYDAAAGTSSQITSISGLSAFLRNHWILVRWLLRRIPGKLKRQRSDEIAVGYFDNEGHPIKLMNLGRLSGVMRRSLDPQPVDTSGVLFRAKRDDEIKPGHDFSNGWSGSFLQGLEIVEMTGDHEDLVRDEKNVAEIARYINAILDRLGPDNQKRIGSPAEGPRVSRISLRENQTRSSESPEPNPGWFKYTDNQIRDSV